jgi:hypothetical protein
MMELYGQGKTDSTTRALWQSYQQRNLIAEQEELAKGMMNFALQSIYFILQRVL